MATELTIEERLVLSRLGECERWMETGRYVEQGCVLLFGALSEDRLTEMLFGLDTLNNLLQKGLIGYELSSRLQSEEWTGHNTTREVQVRYWSVVKNDK